MPRLVLRDCHSFIINETELNDERLSDVLKSAKACSKKTSAEYEILTRQAALLAADIAGELANLDSIAREYEASKITAAQTSLEVEMELSKAKVDAFKQNYNELSAEFTALPVGKSLAEQYWHDPHNTNILKAAAKEAAVEISEKDLLYLSKSKFIAEAYGRYIGVNNEQFFKNAAKQLDNMKAVMSNSGIVVEVSFCERYETEALIAAGTAMHPSAAQAVFERLESRVRSLKKQAEARDEYYPYVKCGIAVFVPMKETISAIHTRIDIGDGEQDNLLDHIEQCCQGDGAAGEERVASLIKAFKAALEEDCKDKQLTPQAECLLLPKRKTMSMADMEDKILTKRAEAMMEQLAEAMMASGELEADKEREGRYAKN